MRRAPTPKARRTEVAADLRTDWTTPLKTAGFDPQKPSAWSVEGILPVPDRRRTNDALHPDR